MANSPGLDHERLKVFVGKWQTDGHTLAGPGEPTLPIHSRDVYEWLPGEFFVVYRWDGTVGEEQAAGIEEIGYDARHERSDDGKNWTAWMDVTLRRIVDVAPSPEPVEREQPMIG